MLTQDIGPGLPKRRPVTMNEPYKGLSWLLPVSMAMYWSRRVGERLGGRSFALLLGVPITIISLMGIFYFVQKRARIELFVLLLALTQFLLGSAPLAWRIRSFMAFAILPLGLLGVGLKGGRNLISGVLRRLEVFAWLSVLLGLVQAGGSGATWFGDPVYEGGRIRISSIFENNQAFLIVLIVIGVGSAQRRRYGLLICAALFLVLTPAKTAILFCIPLFLMLIPESRVTRRILPVLFLTWGLLLGVLTTIRIDERPIPYVAKLTPFASVTATDRMWRWRWNFDQVRFAPRSLIGWGPGSATLLAERGTPSPRYGRTIRVDGLVVEEPHSEYVRLLIEYGYIGVCLLIALALKILRKNRFDKWWPAVGCGYLLVSYYNSNLSETSEKVVFWLLAGALLKSRKMVTRRDGVPGSKFNYSLRTAS
jgi:hypothetical protein